MFNNLDQFIHHDDPEVELANKKAILLMFLDKLAEARTDRAAEVMYRDKVMRRIADNYENDNQKEWDKIFLAQAEARLKKKNNTLRRWEIRVDYLEGRFKPKNDAFDMDTIRAVPIGDIIGREGHKTGHNRVSYCCPIHNEKTPSFVWYSDQNSYACFGCGLAGDNIHLVMHIEKINFIEACRYLTKLC